jgi:tetratricopeptide (TPR) repeat protein
VLDGADSLLGPDLAQNLSQRAELMLQKGNIAYSNGDADAALAAYDQALTFINADAGANPRTRAKILEQRGKSLMDLGKYDEAEVPLMESNQLYRRYDGEQHFSTGLSYYNLALLAYNAGKNDLAQDRIQKSLKIVSRVLDRTNPIRADVLSLQGSIYIAQGQLARADRALADSVSAYQAVYRGPHYNIGFSEFFRAQVATERGQIDQALAHLDAAQHNYEASYGKVHANIGEVLVTRAGLLARQGKLALAVSECSQGITMLNQTMGADSSFTKGLKETCDEIGRKRG